MRFHFTYFKFLRIITWGCLTGLCCILSSCEEEDLLEGISKDFGQYLIAHRGASNNIDVIENTVASVELAIQSGFRGAEIDIRQAADGHWVLKHDNDFGGKEISTSSLSEIKEYKDFPIPTLNEILEVVKKHNSFILFIEIKNGSVEDLNLLLDKYSLKDRIIIISFNQSYCEKAIELGYRVMYLESKLSPEELKEKGYYGADYPYNEYIFNKSIISDCEERNLVVGCWTLNDPKIIKEFIILGMKYITTDILIK